MHMYNARVHINYMMWGWIEAPSRRTIYLKFSKHPLALVNTEVLDLCQAKCVEYNF